MALLLIEPPSRKELFSVSDTVVLIAGKPLNPKGSAAAGTSPSSTAEFITILTCPDMLGRLPVMFNLLSDSVSASKLNLTLKSPIFVAT